MKHSEITCPFCRMGFGGIKVNVVKPETKWFMSRAQKRKAKEGIKTTFQHLDLFWSYESGLIKDCLQNEHMKANLLSVDDCGNPTFNEEFSNKLKELQEDFMNDPSYFVNDTCSFDVYYIAFVNCMNWGNLEEDDEEYDRNDMTGERLKELYENGTNLKDALRSFVVKSIN